MVYLSNYLAREDRFYQMGHQELISTYIPHLQKINPDFDSSWIVTSYHQRVNAAQPVIGTNYSQDMPSHRTPLGGVYLANTTQVYPQDRGTNYSVRMGKHVAHMVMEDMAWLDCWDNLGCAIIVTTVNNLQVLSRWLSQMKR